jgi:hypothetical protein
MSEAEQLAAALKEIESLREQLREAHGALFSHPCLEARIPSACVWILIAAESKEWILKQQIEARPAMNTAVAHIILPDASGVCTLDVRTPRVRAEYTNNGVKIGDTLFKFSEGVCIFDTSLTYNSICNHTLLLPLSWSLIGFSLHRKPSHQASSPPPFPPRLPAGNLGSVHRARLMPGAASYSRCFLLLTASLCVLCVLRVLRVSTSSCNEGERNFRINGCLAWPCSIHGKIFSTSALFIIYFIV